MSCDIRQYKPTGDDPGEMDMRLTAFMGGLKRGNYCVQFTIGSNFCQLTEKSLIDLIHVLTSRILCKDGYSATCSERDDIIYKEED